METFCACKFPCAVNKCDERYHCDCCGYPLGSEDRRRVILKTVGLEIWAIFVLRAKGFRRPERAWDDIYRYLGIQLKASLPPPVRRSSRIRLFSSRHMFVSLDPEARE